METRRGSWHRRRSGQAQNLSDLPSRHLFLFVYLQVADDAERFGSVQAAGGGRRELVGSANQKVSCCRVTATLRAQIVELRQTDLTLSAELLGTGEHL